MPDDPAALWWSVAISIGAFLLNMLVSLAQLSIVSLSDAQLAKLAEDGHKKAKRVVALQDRSTRFIETVRLCNVLLCAVFAAMTVPLLSVSIGDWFAQALPALPATVIVAATVVIALVVSVVVWLLFGELLPRRLAPANAQSIAFSLVGFLTVMLAVVSPLHIVISKLADVIAKCFGVDPSAMDDEVTEEEIRMLVDVGEEKGVIEGSQKEMINNIFEFDDLTAVDIMTPRTDVEAIDVQDSVDDAMTAAVDNGVSRLPVYEEDIDHVVGVLYIKDLMPYVGKMLPEDVTVRSMMREPLFVPETKKCGELFSEMTALHVHMAMVVDEYGGIAGIVTMEDLLESIVGNMQDEYDDEQEEVTQLDDNHYEVEGTTDIEEVAQLLKLEIPEGDYETLGGFLMSLLGRVPDADEHPKVTFENAVFTVLAMDDRRIELIHVELLPPQKDEED